MSDKCIYNRDTRRVFVEHDIHACRECGGWETKSSDRSIQGGELIVHLKTCRFYPSVVQLEIEGRKQ